MRSYTVTLTGKMPLLQLVPEFDDVENVYLEFNIAEKMKGSFEEQSESLSRAIGRPS